MAHVDDCGTCRNLTESDIEVRLEPTDDPLARRYTSAHWPVDGEHWFRSSAEAQAHPLARSLWRGGTASVCLDASGATVTREDARAWPFYEEGLAVSLREQLILSISAA